MKLDTLIKVFGILATITGGVFALYTYLENKKQAKTQERLSVQQQEKKTHRERVEITLSLMEKATSEPMGGYHKKIRTFIDRYQRAMSSKSKSIYAARKGASPEDTRDRCLRGLERLEEIKIMEELIRMDTETNTFIVKADQEIREQLLAFVSFLDRLADCVKEELCDADTAQHSIGTIASELAVYFAPYVNALRISTDDQFGRGLAFFARPFKIEKPLIIMRRRPGSC